MTENTKPSSWKLNLIIDKNKKKVIFAEVEKEFVDFLFNLFSLPLGSLITTLPDKSSVHCMGDLYESINKFQSTYMQPINQIKESILKTNARITMASTTPSAAGKIYACPNNHLSNTQTSHCIECNSLVNNTELRYAKSATGEGGGYVKSLLRYMVTDNLTVKPILTVMDGIIMIRKFETELSNVEAGEYEFGSDEQVAKLLQASLKSTKTAFTDVFLTPV